MPTLASLVLGSPRSSLLSSARATGGASGRRAQPHALSGDHGTALRGGQPVPKAWDVPLCWQHPGDCTYQTGCWRGTRECHQHYERAWQQNLSMESTTIPHCKMGMLYFCAGKARSPQNQCLVGNNSPNRTVKCNSASPGAVKTCLGSRSPNR